MAVFTMAYEQSLNGNKPDFMCDIKDILALLDENIDINLIVNHIGKNDKLRDKR